MKLQTVGDARTIWSFWTVKWNAVLVAVYTAAGIGWLAINDAQREALMNFVGLSPEGQSVLVAAVLFGSAFASALTVQLRALKQAEKVSEKAAEQP